MLSLDQANNLSLFFFSSRRRHTRSDRDWSSDVCSSDLGDPAVKVVPASTNLRAAGEPSRLDSEMYRAIEKASARMYPGATVLPTMSTGATDMAQLRAKGIQSYGIGPASTESDNINYGAHSDVERLLES